ncbi:hypothetical protein [Haladaptatus salinisoli]|nr:hypothetical protein [Haladaptatus salinisoli]
MGKQFGFRLEAPRQVDVTNERHDNPADHHYVVTLDDVGPT